MKNTLKHFGDSSLVDWLFDSDIAIGKLVLGCKRKVSLSIKLSENVKDTQGISAVFMLAEKVAEKLTCLEALGVLP